MNTPNDSKNKLLQSYAHSVPFPVVPLSGFSDGNKAVNYTGDDQKSLGTVAVSVSDTSVYTLFMASDRYPDSTWYNLYDGSKVTVDIPFTVKPSAIFSDSKPIIQELGFRLSTDFPIVNLSELKDGGSYINSLHKGGRYKGTCVIGLDDDTGSYKLYISGGYLPNDSWYDPQGNEVTVSLDSFISGVGVDDNKPTEEEPVVTSSAIQPVSELWVTDLSHPLNSGNGQESGKVVGACCVAIPESGVPYVAFASGTEPDSPWFKMGTTDSVTPSK